MKTKPITETVITLSDEAKHAVVHNAPSYKQLIKCLNSNQLKDVPSDRHLRWMASAILREAGFKFEYKGKPVE